MAPALDKERLLLLRLKKGDYQAFKEIYHLYKLRLAGNIFKLVKSEELTEDILQDVFLKVWEMREMIDPDRSFRSFLFRISENLVYDLYRKIAREKRVLEIFWRDKSEDYLHVEESVFYKESGHQLQEAIDALPEQCRKVFVLFRIEGKSYREIAEIMNISSSTINNHLTRANQLLKKRLPATHLAFFYAMTSALFGGW